eukprot:TRINITY_DN2490_c0_g1_i1.p1 TRINITY_DN2490_c0_g1~~TRINITY_DN2490_c0_g1_i1.p1  ORF type:complete len:551 (-),score=82.01 TRINITY_DN2490_c0_g1_i1:570-2222(-)
MLHNASSSSSLRDSASNANSIPAVGSLGLPADSAEYETQDSGSQASHSRPGLRRAAIASTSSNMIPARVAAIGFPAAAQPEVMRAAEKDEEYLSSISDSCYDLVRSLAGTRVAVALNDEARLTGRVLYYLLTTGAGLQTLGEEYVGIEQVAGEQGVPTSPSRRALLVFLHTVVPYLAERIGTRVAANGARLQEQEEENQRLQRSRVGPSSASSGRSSDSGSASGSSGPSGSRQHDGASNSHSSSSSNVGSSSSRNGVNGSRSLNSEDRDEQQQQQQQPHFSRGGGTGTFGASEQRDGSGGSSHANDVPSSEQSVGHGQRPASAALARRRPARVNYLRQVWLRMLRGWPTLLPVVKEAMQLAFRTHLMLFYFEGLYYHWSKRMMGIRYIFTGRASEQRPRYHVLGMFLLVQVSLLGGEWLRRNVLPALLAAMTAQREGGAPGSGGGGGQQGAALLDGDGREVVEGKAGQNDADVAALDWTTSDTSAAVLEARAKSKCPLCLSVRVTPTATSCGHVFCWHCIAEWCNEKPECPLCRSPSRHASLVPLAHSDF